MLKNIRQDIKENKNNKRIEKIVLKSIEKYFDRYIIKEYKDLGLELHYRGKNWSPKYDVRLVATEKVWETYGEEREILAKNIEQYIANLYSKVKKRYKKYYIRETVSRYVDFYTWKEEKQENNE